ncbi:hypothetical protein [Brevundimonas sp.]|uniref:hypothetical protein n=1 Tax=Brevundimonas sp. TaxID=1871086 RepID=UPI002BA6391C|nr:hypothetical protein [Brevundimonas sp.]HWQ86421.1 hypothetical protein [Brevundimonas sp.]
MKTIGKLIAATAIALAAASSATSVASAAIPWYEWTGYYTNGVLTGEVFYFCDGRIRERGDLIVWDEAVYEHYYDCP